jgi:guanylate cyclase
MIASQYDQVSVLFADVVSFTPMSALMTPVELVELLNDIFSDFDMLVDKFRLEKIKTIGDCSMVAAGSPQARPDHAHILTQMAIEAVDYFDGHPFR